MIRIMKWPLRLVWKWRDVNLWFKTTSYPLGTFDVGTFKLQVQHLVYHMGPVKIITGCRAPYILTAKEVQDLVNEVQQHYQNIQFSLSESFSEQVKRYANLNIELTKQMCDAADHVMTVAKLMEKHGLDGSDQLKAILDALTPSEAMDKLLITGTVNTTGLLH